MSADHSSTVQDPQPESTLPGRFAALLFSPTLWGGLVTVGFYTAIPYLPIQREMAERYFCGHPIEYVTTGLFFVGMALLARKWLRVSTERAAFSGGGLDHAGTSPAGDVNAQLAAFDTALRALPPALRGTQLAERVRDVCQYVSGRGSPEGLDEHLKYRAELASERLNDSFALVRTVTWAIPILGFLGTVMGITMAIANLQPEQLATSLDEVTGGLAVAFDTTALSLALSLVLVFGAFLVERAEQNVLVEVEEFGVKRLAPLFPAAPAAANPLAEAEGEAARQWLETTESLIAGQTQLWNESLESLRQRCVAMMTEQTQEFRAALQQGLRGTLEDHTGQLAAIRGEFLESFRGASRDLSAMMDKAHDGQQALQSDLREQLEQTWSRIGQGLASLRDEESQRVTALLDGLSQSVATWQTSLEASAATGQSQLVELRRQGELLSQIVGQEHELLRLQGRLTENLEAVRAAETFEETLHSLNAAVHLLAGRTRPKVA